MPKQHWMISLVRTIAVLFVLVGCLMVFWYTPFYSKLVAKALDSFVPVNVDEVAAQSQQMAALTETEDLEPGSKSWIARQAYLSLMEQKIRESNTQDLVAIQARYKILLDEIDKQQRLEDQAKDSEAKHKIAKIPVVIARPDEETGASSASHSNLNLVDQQDLTSEATISEEAVSEAMILEKDLSEPLISEADSTVQLLKSDADQALRERYTEFLLQHPLNEPEVTVDDQIYKDIAQIQHQNLNDAKKKELSKPYAIVVLGGGLTLGDNRLDIVVNEYTRLRLEKTLDVEHETQLPIVLSGVEAPYMQAWLKNKGVEANLLENRSMNTCENTRFSSLLLQKKGGAPTVILITDRYHMPRTRRLFALNGIQTIPVEAPMPTQLTAWRPSKQNYDHSRRANYEMLATIRDVLFGSSGCREVP
ncbi:YdcF family protein [Acinetobacter lanii]|uniref:YdcF family protein n=1 Tax=Acinetobacter lanii TaxID=2715163 RepID=A0A6G8S5D4_9GAMM|nr:YdcF family protein [Acinetobacter lanii]QIO09183.1 YdcF family protein [Acinetobacter lanii]